MVCRWGLVPGLAATLAVIAGCWSARTIDHSNVYAGPTMTLTSSAGQHMLVVRAPTPGWLITIDRTEHHLEDSLIFVTLQRPDPGALYAQVEVEQRVLTTVPTSRAVVVYARTIDFGQRKKLPPYRRVMDEPSD